MVSSNTSIPGQHAKLSDVSSFRALADLVAVMRALVKQMPLLDGCVIETTGIADPSPVTQSFFADEVCSVAVVF